MSQCLHGIDPRRPPRGYQGRKQPGREHQKSGDCHVERPNERHDKLFIDRRVPGAWLSCILPDPFQLGGRDLSTIQESIENVLMSRSRELDKDVIDFLSERRIPDQAETKDCVFA